MDYVDERTEVEKLQDTFSDFYKDVHGYRPRFHTHEQWNSVEWLTAAIQALHDYIESRTAIFADREQLREDGWYMEETDPMLAQYAVWLKQERDRRNKELYGGDF